MGPALGRRLVGEVLVADFTGGVGACPDDGGVVAVWQMPRLDIGNFETARGQATGVVASEFRRSAKGLHVCSPDLVQPDC